jgi:hypothetical protein
MKLIFAALIIAFCVSLTALPVIASEPELVDDITGANLAMIQIAWTEYGRKVNHDPIESYRVYLYRQDETITVIFRDADWSDSQRGGHQFEVEISTTRNQIIRSQLKSWR